MNERRIQRVQELLKERVAEILDRDLVDPRRAMITVTRVKVDRDLTLCHVYWSVLGDDGVVHRVDRMLGRAAGWVQREVAKELHTRTVPRVKFIHDVGLAKAEQVDRILAELREARGDAADPDVEDGESPDPQLPAEPAE